MSRSSLASQTWSVSEPVTRSSQGAFALPAALRLRHNRSVRPASPIGLLLVPVVAYALGAVRVAGQGALVQQTNAIESLSNVDTFCLDKTGTLTTNRLQVHDIHPFGISRDALQRWLGDFVASATTSNKTSEAIAQELPGQKQPAIDEVPFSSARKWSALVFDGQDEGSHENPTTAT